MDKILIQDLLARGIIGINQWEREKPQEILINLIIFFDLHRVGESDEIDDTINYREISRQTIALAESAQRLTVEALATDLARLVLQDIRIEKVLVRVEKPGAIPFSRSVGVEIERSRQDFSSAKD